jgi:hypothetical protein
MNFRFLAIASLTAMSALTPPKAHATAILGSFSFTGLEGFTIDTSSFSTATTVSFNAPDAIYVTSAYGTFAALSGATGTITDKIVFSPLSSASADGALFTFTVAGETIEWLLSSITAADVGTGGLPSLTLEGTALVEETGEADTTGSFILTLNADGGFITTSFSGSAGVRDVVEPTPLSLLGTGIVGLGLLARRRSRRRAALA